jgi:hypothetical protein
MQPSSSPCSTRCGCGGTGTRPRSPGRRASRSRSPGRWRASPAAPAGQPRSRAAARGPRPSARTRVTTPARAARAGRGSVTHRSPRPGTCAASAYHDRATCRPSRQTPGERPLGRHGERHDPAPAFRRRRRRAGRPDRPPVVPDQHRPAVAAERPVQRVDVGGQQLRVVPPSLRDLRRRDASHPGRAARKPASASIGSRCRHVPAWSGKPCRHNASGPSGGPSAR